MNVVLWLIAGGAISAAASSALHLNLARGLIVSAVIGALAAFVGGHVLTAMFGGEVLPYGEFNPFALVVAGVTALVALKVADMVYERFQF